VSNQSLFVSIGGRDLEMVIEAERVKKAGLEQANAALAHDLEKASTQLSAAQREIARLTARLSRQTAAAEDAHAVRQGSFREGSAGGGGGGGGDLVRPKGRPQPSRKKSTTSDRGAELEEQLAKAADGGHASGGHPAAPPPRSPATAAFRRKKPSTADSAERAMAEATALEASERSGSAEQLPVVSKPKAKRKSGTAGPGGEEVDFSPVPKPRLPTKSKRPVKAPAKPPVNHALNKHAELKDFLEECGYGDQALLFAALGVETMFDLAVICEGEDAAVVHDLGMFGMEPAAAADLVQKVKVRQKSGGALGPAAAAAGGGQPGGGGGWALSADKLDADGLDAEERAAQAHKAAADPAGSWLSSLGLAAYRGELAELGVSSLDDLLNPDLVGEDELLEAGLEDGEKGSTPRVPHEAEGV